MSDVSKVVENIAKESTKVLGSDIHPISLEKRIAMTPKNDVEWSGLRGQSYCKPTSPEIQEKLKQYEVDGIPYSLKGEPDFSKVALAKVKISDMTEDMGHDYTSTIHRLLGTEFAKEKGITTPTEMRKYISENNLTIHEGQDGVTEYLIDRSIHQTFRHYGGRGTLRGFENPDSERIIQTKISEGAVNVNKTIVRGTEEFEKLIVNTNDFIEQQTSRFLSKDLVEINRAGLDEATKTALFAATLSITKNTFDVVKGDIETEEAVKKVLVDTSSAAVLSYVTGVTKTVLNLDNKGDEKLIVTGTVQLSKQVFCYLSGEIDEKQLLENIAETSAFLAAAYIGKTLGSTVGSSIAGPVGGMIGRYVGEMITTAVCATVIDTVHREKEAKKYNDRMIALAHRAEKEIQVSQERLKYIVQGQNDELVRELNLGYDRFLEGMHNFDYAVASSGLAIIGKQFGVEEEKLTQGHVTQGNIFGKKNRVIKMG